MKSRKIQKAFTNCFLLNCLIFSGQSFIYEYFIMNYFPSWILYIIYNPILLLTYIISLIVSSFWFNDIAEEAIKIEQTTFNNKQAYRSESVTLESRIYNEIYHIVFVMFFLL